MLRELLDPGRILISGSTETEEIFRSCIERLGDTTAQEAAREGLALYPDSPFGSLEDEILIPHFRVPGLSQPEAVLAVLPQAVQGKTALIRLIVILATPEFQTALHLRLLQGLSSLLPQAEAELLRCRVPSKRWLCSLVSRLRRTVKGNDIQ